VRLLIQFLCIGLLFAAGNLASDWLTSAVDIEVPDGELSLLRPTVLLSALVYALVLAIPFVPGAEIGIAMMIMAGPQAAVLVYISTIVGLTLSFLIGRLLPVRTLTGCLEWLGLTRMQRLLDLVAQLSPQDRLAFLISRAPNRFIPFLLRNRHIALAIALNIPGNSLIGGGGGIVLLSGISNLFTTPAFILTIMLAVAPVPLIVLLFGIDLFSG
jgi:hypothetical protein